MCEWRTDERKEEKTAWIHHEIPSGTRFVKRKQGSMQAVTTSERKIASKFPFYEIADPLY